MKCCPRIMQKNLTATQEEKDHTGIKVLQLFNYLRDVFFQDAAIFQDKYPTLVIFQLPVS
jgi:hypothetical protein